MPCQHVEVGREMGVHVDEAGGDHSPGCIDLAVALAVEVLLDRNDAVACDCDVCLAGRRSAAVDHSAATDYEICFHASASSDYLICDQVCHAGVARGQHRLLVRPRARRRSVRYLAHDFG